MELYTTECSTCYIPEKDFETTEVEHKIINTSGLRLYTTGCPQCRVLEKKLEVAGIEYETINDLGLMQQLGLASAPVLEVNGKFLTFAQAIEWVKENSK